MPDSYRIGIAGLGTVGAGVVKILQENAELIGRRAGRKIEVVAVSARDKKRKRAADMSAYKWCDKPLDLLNEKIDAVVELIGGSEGPARELVTKALEKGLDVVTANKALIATHGAELAKLAEKNNARLNYEASVAGCVPIIKALREGLAANKITGVYGILNGTCNYILTQMRETGRDFSVVLKEAQEKGYAEADPSFDIDGVDTGHKICILSSIAFGVRPVFSKVQLKGIRHLTSEDITFAGQLGYKIKLLGIAKERGGKISISVEPCMVPQASPLGAIEDVYNAVFVEGGFVETPLFTGRGAGQDPTGSAVVADLIDLARGLKIPTFGVPEALLADPVFFDPGQIEGRYYLRFSVLDKPGVMADVAAILRDHNISIESVLQRGRDPGQAVPLVITTHETRYADMINACGIISKLKTSVSEPCVIRIESTL